MAAGGKILAWDIPPKNGQEVYFSRDIYEKYSLAPTLSELLLLSKRNAEGNTDKSNPGQENRTSGGQESVQVGAQSSANSTPFQEPRVPYPHLSSLTEREQRKYLLLLPTYLKAKPSLTDTSEQCDYSQYLQMKVRTEVAEFLKFAQNAARACAKDYDSISEKALLYSKRFLSSCIGCVKKYPECYTLHEVTSIMGGKFSTELTLRLEARLLALGKVNLIKLHFPNMPAEIQLPANLKSAMATPEQRASLLHHDISTDPNAEKLVAKYCPQVVLTSESLFTLLNNHGLNYKEPWELPVSVKNISAAGCKPATVAYIDPPLPKKEMTVREKNQFFHALLTDFHTTKQSSVLASAAVLDKPHQDPENLDTLETCQGRPMQVFDSMDLDFDTDVTEFETFGSTSKSLKVSEKQSAPAKPANPSKIQLEELLKMEERLLAEVSSSTGERRNQVSDHLASTHSGGQNSDRTPSTGRVLGLDYKGDSSCQSFESMEVGLSGKGGAAAVKEDKNDNKPSLSSYQSDTDEEPLVIDTECKNTNNTKPRSSVADSPELPCPTQDLSGAVADPPEVPDPETNTSQKSCQKLSEGFDPVQQILKMQTKLLKPLSSNCPGQADVSTANCSNPAPSQTPLLLKESIASALTSGQSTTADTGTLPKSSWLSHFQGSQKGSLWDAVENPLEYDAPEQGNLVYKLFSLDNLLLLVRSSIQKVEIRPRKKKIKTRRHFPVYVLPKLEYQAFYGAEVLTESEICRLWTENLLHSNCSFVVGHIDALTSKLFLVEELSAEHLKRRFGTFKPANSLNILQHILKKVAG
ncbi:little elongation complex subunit 2 isoform X2 [Eublepharis macularius]|nr:little elongation complex subunit 2 isoform X2 [Eublepharis macularius]